MKNKILFPFSFKSNATFKKNGHLPGNFESGGFFNNTAFRLELCQQNMEDQLIVNISSRQERNDCNTRKLYKSF